MKVFKRGGGCEFDELLFLEKVSKRLLEGFSLERSLFMVLRERDFEAFKDRLVQLIRGFGPDKVLERLPFKTGLPRYVAEINRIRSVFAGRVLEETVNVILLNRRCQKERMMLLDLLYYRSVIVTFLMGLTLSFLSQMAPLFSIITEFAPTHRLTFSVDAGIQYFSFTLGLFSSFLQNLLFGRRRALNSIAVYVLSFLVGSNIRLPIHV